MKKLILLLFISHFAIGQQYGIDQSYFEGKRLHCPSQNPEARKLFDSGIKILHLNSQLKPKYLMINANVFADAIMKDTLFCDAYFFAGYTLGLANKYKESYAFYMVADTLNPNPSLLYKLNAAAACLKVGDFSRARYIFTKMTDYFPESAEGYYGVAVTAPMHGDYENGLQKLEKAFEIYKKQSYKPGKETYLIKAVLLTLNKQYAESLPIFDDISSAYRKDLNFNMYYSLSLLKISEQTHDEKMKKQARKHYDRIKNKDEILPELRDLYTF